MPNIRLSTHIFPNELFPAVRNLHMWDRIPVQCHDLIDRAMLSLSFSEHMMDPCTVILPLLAAAFADD